jgi:two-component system, chemotaxis family, response regulator Rcp1
MTMAIDKRSNSRSRPLEILLIEDNAGDVLLIELALKKGRLANNVANAQDGEKALLMLRRQKPFEHQPRPDLILLDLHLPKMDGREVLEEIKQDPALSAIPVVVLSGSQAEAEIARTYALRANAYIVKPIDFENLARVFLSIEDFWFGVASLPTHSQHVG